MLTAKELLDNIAGEMAAADDPANDLRIRLTEYVDGVGKQNWTSTPLGRMGPQQFKKYGEIVSPIHDLHPMVDWHEVPFPTGRHLRELTVSVANFTQGD